MLCNVDVTQKVWKFEDQHAKKICVCDYTFSILSWHSLASPLSTYAASQGEITPASNEHSFRADGRRWRFKIFSSYSGLADATRVGRIYHTFTWPSAFKMSAGQFDVAIWIFKLLARIYHHDDGGWLFKLGPLWDHTRTMKIIGLHHHQVTDDLARHAASERLRYQPGRLTGEWSPQTLLMGNRNLLLSITRRGKKRSLLAPYLICPPNDKPWADHSARCGGAQRKKKRAPYLICLPIQMAAVADHSAQGGWSPQTLLMEETET